MFTRSFAEITGPFEEAEAALLRRPQIWLTGADAPYAKPDLDSDEIYVDFGAAGLTENVYIAIGRLSRHPTKTNVSVSWHASSPSSLFPRLEGLLEISRVGPRQTLLALLVEYQPPVDPFGEILDGALLHRIAAATVSIFRDTVALALDEHALPDRSPSRGDSGR